jgi:serine beta-lactamase-like protein LACTB, mitochondrial
MPSPRLLLLGVLLLPLPSLAQQPALPPAQAAAVDDVVRAEMTRQQVVGVAVGVIRDGRVVYLKGYGLADREKRTSATADTVFNWASNSKPLAAVAAMQLADRKLLDLDADVRKYVPEYPATPETITTRHLLCHQSGVPHYSNGKVVPTERKYDTPVPFLDPVRALDKFNRSPLLFKPGAKVSYSSYAYVLLSAVVQRAGRELFTLQVDERIGKPLRMKSLQLDADFQYQPDWAAGYLKTLAGQVVRAADEAHDWKYGAGGYKSNVGDFARWAEALVNHKLVSESAERQMWTTQKLSNGDATTWGLGFTVVEDQSGLKVSHNGSQEEVATRMVIYPKRRAGVVVMSNCRFAKPAEFTTAVFAALDRK